MSADADDPPNRLSQYLGPKALPAVFDNAATFIRENIVLPLRKKDRPVYYHRQFDRVPTIDQCEIGDSLCRWEANEQFLRDKKVDTFKLKILRRRWTECNRYWGDTRKEKCMQEKEDFMENSINWYLRYGDVGRQFDCLDNYMKQKHRMIWVRRKKAMGEEVDYRQ